jgi:type II secretory pathway component PulC
MEAKTPRPRWQVWISVSAAAGLIFFYLYASRWQFDPSPTPTASPDAKSSDPSFSGHRTPIKPAPVVSGDRTSEFKLAVSGVMITAASRTALISIDDRPAAPFVEGQQIVDGVVLNAVNPDRIVVKRGDDLVRLPVRGVQSAESARSELPAWVAEPASTDPPSPGTEQKPRPRDPSD